MQQQTARSLAAWPPCAAPRLQLRPVRALRATRRPAALRPPRAERLGGSGGSFDGEEKLDYSLTRELDSVAGRERYQKLSQHLELLYQASQSQSERNKVELCQCCRGSGERECEWCHGTGAMTVGDVLYCSEGGCTPCPVCRGSGGCKCDNCRGTGRRASWLPLGPS